MKNQGYYLYSRTLIIGIAFLFTNTSCKKLIEINSPVGQITNDKVFTSDATAAAAMVAIYSDLNGTQALSDFPTLTTECASDNLTNLSGTYLTFNSNSIAVNDDKVSAIWQNSYSEIYRCNSIIENLEEKNGVTVSLKNQLIGEAKFLRGFFYFQLVNLYGSVPLTLTTDVDLNLQKPQSEPSEIYSQIINDLKSAQTLLGESYITTERVRANKFAATALLARVYLYVKDWQNAEIQSSLVINNSQYTLLSDLKKVFVKNSSETILQAWTPQGFTRIGTSLIPRTNLSFALTSNFIDSFTPGDNRQIHWINSFTINGTQYYYPSKYRLNSANSSVDGEYFMVLRLAEQFLIRAEARINNNMIPAGIVDLNIIRARSRAVSTALVPNPLPALPTTMALNDAKSAVESERRTELFSEWGHRWLDLKRTGRINEVLSLVKTSWKPFASQFPIPLTQINANARLKQNTGY